MVLWLFLAFAVFLFVISFFTLGIAGFLAFVASMLIFGYCVGALVTRHKANKKPVIRK